MNNIKRMALFADRYISGLSKLMLYMATLIVLYLLFSLSYYVITRYLFDWSNGWIFETSKYALLFIIFLPLGYSQKLGQHIKVDALTCRLSPRVNARLGIVTTVISIFAFIIFTWSTVDYSLTGRHWDSGPLYYWPLFPILIMMPIGLGMLALQLFITLIKQIAALSAGEPDNIAKTGDSSDVKLGGVRVADIAKN